MMVIKSVEVLHDFEKRVTSFTHFPIQGVIVGAVV